MNYIEKSLLQKCEREGQSHYHGGQGRFKLPGSDGVKLHGGQGQDELRRDASQDDARRRVGTRGLGGLNTAGAEAETSYTAASMKSKLHYHCGQVEVNAASTAATS